MAVRITRRPNTIALLGAPTSAAALAAGHERAPAALRAAGLVDRLRAAGFEVNDLGDDPVVTWQPDEESPRARNVRAVVRSLEALRPRVELAVKSGALPLILGGDCSIALAAVAGVRRYFRNVSMIYLDRDADLNIPATSPSGCVDGMVVSHLTGRGAPELVRFWSEPPLVREPDLALFGTARLDLPEEEFLAHSPLRRYLAAGIQRMGVLPAAEQALDRVHGGHNEFIVHFDVDVIASEDFGATDFPGLGGLRLEEVRQALAFFLRQPKLAALEVTVFNPEKDPDGSAARQLVDLLVSLLSVRFEAPKREAASTDSASAAPPGPAPSAAPVEPAASAPTTSSPPPAAQSPAPSEPAPPAAAPPEPASAESPSETSESQSEAGVEGQESPN